MAKKKTTNEQQTFTRFHIIQLVRATNQILVAPEMKSSLDGKQIYAVHKLNARLMAENKHTLTREQAIRAAARSVMDDANIANGEKTKAKREMDADLETLFNEQVDNMVEIKIPFDAAESIMKHLSGDCVKTAIEYLIESPIE